MNTLEEYGLKTFYASEGGDSQLVVDAEELIILIMRAKPYKLHDVEGRFLVPVPKPEPVTKEELQAAIGEKYWAPELYRELIQKLIVGGYKP